jgi:Cft2 family RNA processing exonuclease
MQDKPSGADNERATTTADLDDRDQTAVLRETLALYPELLTLDELIREQTFGSAEFASRDRIERAVRDLIAVGLLQQVGPLVLPTRAAVVLYRLFEL